MPSALVTGSAKGIGRALALALAAAGYNVAVHYRSSRAEAAQVVRDAQQCGVRAQAFCADVTDEAQAVKLVTDVIATFGSLEVLVNNVGNYHYGPLEALTSQVWHEMINSNLHSTFYLCQAALPQMCAQGYGRILNLGFAGAEILKARPHIAPYAIAKTGVILYSKALAKRYSGRGVTVNVISPGIMENSVTQPTDEIPIKRPGRLAELASAALYLLSDEAAYVSGVTLEVAGGWNV